MIFYLELAVAWVLFLAIFPLTVGMFYRAWKIAVRREWHYVAPWYGNPVPQPQRWAHWFAGINMLGGSVLFAILISIIVFGAPFSKWATAVALTIWMYYITTQLLARKARGSLTPQPDSKSKGTL
jgi:hypothetical protein